MCSQQKTPNKRPKIIPFSIIESSLITLDSLYTPVTMQPQCHNL